MDTCESDNSNPEITGTRKWAKQAKTIRALNRGTKLEEKRRGSRNQKKRWRTRPISPAAGTALRLPLGAPPISRPSPSLARILARQRFLGLSHLSAEQRYISPKTKSFRARPFLLLGSLLTGRFFSRLEGNSRISGGFSRFADFLSTPAKYLKNNISRIAGKSCIVAEHRVASPCEPCAPCRRPALHRTDQGNSQGHSQAVAGRRKRRAQRELYSSSRQSRLTDTAEINTKSPTIFTSLGALSLQKLSLRGTARHGRLSRSRGTYSGTIQRTACARAAGFDDSVRWTSVATSQNMIPGVNRTHRIFFAFVSVNFPQNGKKKIS